MRTRRDVRLENRSGRARLPIRASLYGLTLEPGRYLAYRKPKNGGAGTWFARLWNPEVGKILQSRLGTADDFGDSDGVTILSFGQAQERAREWFRAAHSLATGEETRTGPYRVRDAMADYLKDCIRRGIKRMDRIESATDLHILPALGEVEVAKLTQARIEAWHSELVEADPCRRQPKGKPRPANRRAKALSKSQYQPTPTERPEEAKRRRKATANRVLTILKAALNRAKSRGLVACSGDAWRESKPFKGADAPRVRYLTVPDQVRLVNACKWDFQRLVRGALFTGARYEELGRIRVEDLNLQDGSVFIRPGKTGAGRHVVLTEEGMGFFQEAAQGLDSGSLLFTKEAFPDMRRVTPVTRQPLARILRPWGRSDQGRIMRETCEKAGIDPLGFHQLRHSYASGLVSAGVPLAFVAQMLGHADTRMVEKHYGHLAPSAVKAAIRQLSPRLGIHFPGVAG